MTDAEAVLDRPATPNLVPLDDLVEQISLHHGGESVLVEGPFVDGFGQFYRATVRDVGEYRVELNGFIRSCSPYGYRTIEWEPEEARA